MSSPTPSPAQDIAATHNNNWNKLRPFRRDATPNHPAQPSVSLLSSILQPPTPTQEHSNALYTTPSASSSSAGAHDTHVLSRLHALFTPSSSAAGPSSPSHLSPRVTPRPCPGDKSASASPVPSLGRAKTEPITGSGTTTPVPQPPKDRESIKVFLVTWNMGDALPKGDLAVLLGEIPEYQHKPPTSGVPELTIANEHPYHIVVVAGQECPTDSRVPRGLGGGLMKGMAIGLTGHKKEKDILKDKDDSASADSASIKSTEKEEKKVEEKKLDIREDLDQDAWKRPTSPVPPHTPLVPLLHHRPTPKGWSHMLDEWLCGPMKPETAFLPPDRPSADTVPSSPLLSATLPVPPPLIRSSSAPPVSSTPTQPMAIPESVHHHAIEHLNLSQFAPSPLSRSSSSVDSNSSSSSSEAGPSFQTPLIAGPFHTHANSPSVPIKTDHEKMGLLMPDTPRPPTYGGGSYVHVAKERLMGLYLSVYVYKGCEHLVQGVDKDYVTAGLVRGRLGNKGGIGISLKLADHRFLFVNSHLAAHTSRQAARLANIAKIKTDLQLKHFLPHDDPRGLAEDITDRYDTVFWCGDLNFRLDLSRLHAEWLVEHKKFSEALMWDQLREVMKDPRTNPFPGFEEGPINFAPTFKYDVWKSIKSTNRDLRRSLRRRATLEGKSNRPGSLEVGRSMPAGSPLTHVPEADGDEEYGVQLDNDIDEHPTGSRSSRRSFDSGAYSVGQSTTQTDAEDDDGEVSRSINASAYGSRHKALEVAIKAKTKHFLSLIKLDGVVTPSSKAKTRPRGQTVTSKISSYDFGDGSRRTSVSSLGSMLEEADLNGGSSTMDQYSRSVSSGAPPFDAISGHLGVTDRRPSLASSAWTASPQKSERKMSVLKRTISGLSAKDDARTPDVVENGADVRLGVYDTSKKQRVPSWCDRVLWKAHVTPDPDEEDEGEPESPLLTPGRDRPFGRLSQAFTNFGGHLRTQLTRSSTNDAVSPVEKTRNDRPLLPPSQESFTPPKGSSSAAIVESPAASSKGEWNEQELENGHTPGANRPIVQHTRSTTPRHSPTTPHHPLLDMSRTTSYASVSQSAAAPLLQPVPAQPKITFDAVSSAVADRPPRVRSNSDNLLNDSPEKVASTSSRQSSVSPTTSPHRRLSGSSPQRQRRRLSLVLHNAKTEPVHDDELSNKAHEDHSHQRMNSRLGSFGSLGRRTDTLDNRFSAEHDATGNGPRDEQKNAFVKFLKDLPNWLHGRGSIDKEREKDKLALLVDGLEGEGVFKRHLKGEVVCLHYGTIDDAGMRQLEGRSDHRPAIFSAAVYI